MRKKIIISILCVIFIFLTTMVNATSYSDGSGTLIVADTTDDYVTGDTVTWNCSEYKDKTVIVKNTGAESLTLRIKLNAYYGGLEYTFQEGTLDVSSDAIIYFEPYFQVIDIAVKSNSGITSAVIDWGGGL